MKTKITTNEYSRRDAIKLGAAGASAMALSPLGVSAVETAKPKIEAKAKSVIQIWMWGGPSHIDTFDPKPGAGYDYLGPLDKPIGTNVDGIQIGQLLPLLAKQADKYSIIRSMTHGDNGHETASYMLQTGHFPGRLVYPSVGGIVGLFKGYDYGYQGLVPPYIVLTRPQGRFSEAGFLGSKYKPYATGGDPNRDPFAVEGIVLEGINEERQRARRDLIQNLDTLGDAIKEEIEFAKHKEAEDKAYDMILGDAGKLFDLSTEDEKLRDAYGRSTFGQSCLMARRLVEAGVPYITINYGGWDTHKEHFQIMNRKLPEMDAGMATLFADLSDRGLLDTTIVWWTGEFGRTPNVQWEAPWNGGRSHFGRVFSGVIAGGGFKGGQVLGASDKKASYVEERPVYPPDLIAQIYKQLGIDPDGPLPNPSDMALKVMPTAGEDEMPRGGLVTELV